MTEARTSSCGITSMDLWLEVALLAELERLGEGEVKPWTATTTAMANTHNRRHMVVADKKKGIAILA